MESYVMRPNASTNPRGCFQNVCNTPLHGLLAEFIIWVGTKLVCETSSQKLNEFALH